MSDQWHLDSVKYFDSIRKNKSCHCKNVEMGSYDNQVMLSTKFTEMAKYKEAVSVDVCIAREVQDLWNKGIITVGCCCGHGNVSGYIQTTPEMLEPMTRMGYVRFENKLNPIDPCFFLRDHIFNKAQGIKKENKS